MKGPKYVSSWNVTQQLLVFISEQADARGQSRIVKMADAAIVSHEQEMERYKGASKAAVLSEGKDL